MAKIDKNRNPMAFVDKSGEPEDVCYEEKNSSPTLFGQARRTRDALGESLNNLGCLLARLRQQPGGDEEDPQKCNPDSLEDVLTDCNYMARRLASISQELSGIVGE